MDIATLFWTVIGLFILLIVGFFVVMLALAVAAVVFRKRWRAMLEKIVLPDTAATEQQFSELLARHPGISHEEIIRAIIREHANKAALIGAALGAGGVFFEVLGAPAADAVTLLRVQANMIFLLAHAHGLTGQLSENDRLKLVLVLSGSNQVAQYVMKMLAKMLFTAVPLVGSVVAYLVNYGVVRATGEAARIQFSGNPVKNEVQGIVQNLFHQARQRAAQVITHSSRLAGSLGNGATTSQPEVMQVTLCRNCDTATSVNNRFCSACGAPLYDALRPARNTQHPLGGFDEFDIEAQLRG